MREVHISKITETVKKLCIDANYYLPKDVKKRLIKAKEEEKFPVARNIINILIENADIAQEENRPMCQDTGMAVIFVEIGQDIHVVGGGLEDAINEGVRQGYRDGALRKSVVGDPLERINTKDNTPAIIHYQIAPGDTLKITVAPKGFGSENMSQLKMLKPADGLQGVKDFVLKVVKEAGPNPCPPIIVGIGLGGSFDKAAILAKKALMRSTEVKNKNSYYANLEEELLKKLMF